MQRDNPTSRSSRPRHSRSRGGSHRWLVVGVVVAIAVVAAAAVVVTGHSSPSSDRRQHALQATTASTAVPTTASTAPAANQPLCPLTGSPVPGGGAVPQRPALAVKVTNYPTARPQTGLNDADIIFEEPVEGSITRYVAVFQCQEAKLVGPIRSARNIDIGILGQFGSPLLANMGGIDPVLANIEASPIIELNLLDLGTATQHVPGRVAPYDTYASTAALWGLKSTDTTPPAPIFTYTNATPSGPGVSPVASVSIPFSTYSTVVWKYDSKLHAFLRYYSHTPDVLSTGAQETAANVIVQFVQITYGPWVENSLGALEVQANLYDDASGPALIFRSGVEVSGTWSRSSLGQATQFTTTGGQPISLQPGQTWVELVPNTVTVTSKP